MSLVAPGRHLPVRPDEVVQSRADVQASALRRGQQRHRQVSGAKARLERRQAGARLASREAPERTRCWAEPLPPVPRCALRRGLAAEPSGVRVRRSQMLQQARTPPPHPPTSELPFCPVPITHQGVHPGRLEVHILVPCSTARWQEGRARRSERRHLPPPRKRGTPRMRLLCFLQPCASSALPPSQPDSMAVICHRDMGAHLPLPSLSIQWKKSTPSSPCSQAPWKS